ncbi:alpha/beta fold hydrolase, partial [Methylophilus sp.]
YVPTLLVLGSEGIVSTDTALELHKLNPELQYKLIPDAGHGLPYDEPARLAAAVDAFLRPVAASAQRFTSRRNVSSFTASYSY